MVDGFKDRSLSRNSSSCFLSTTDHEQVVSDGGDFTVTAECFDRLRRPKYNSGMSCEVLECSENVICMCERGIELIDIDFANCW
jgi:hypothetical protein